LNVWTKSRHSVYSGNFLDGTLYGTSIAYSKGCLALRPALPRLANQPDFPSLYCGLVRLMRQEIFEYWPVKDNADKYARVVNPDMFDLAI